MMKLLQTANNRRSTEATKANETSSRSHAILQLTVYKKPRAAGYEYEQKVGKLNMIDLAASDRGSVTENRGIRLFEGAKINRSLLTLANCINALGDKSRKVTFVPSRDSKLTRLLKDSLGGKSRTLMLCAIAPGSVMFEETLNTLKYSNRAKEIKVQAEENKKVVELHIAEFKGIFEDLWRERTELFDMAEASKGDATEDLVNLEKSADLNIKTDNEQRIRQLSEQINALLGTIEENLPSPDARRVVGEVVQLKAIEIENMELEINLKFYEQLNRLMMVECKALQQSLVEAGFDPEEEGPDQVQEEEEQPDIEETNREIDELKKKMQESGIEFGELDPNQLADEQQSNYDGIDSPKAKTCRTPQTRRLIDSSAQKPPFKPRNARNRRTASSTLRTRWRSRATRRETSTPSWACTTDSSAATRLPDTRATWA